MAAELIASLDEPTEPDEDVEAAWADEIQRRLAEVDAGAVAPIPWSEARSRVFAVYGSPSASRSSSRES